MIFLKGAIQIQHIYILIQQGNVQSFYHQHVQGVQ